MTDTLNDLVNAIQPTVQTAAQYREIVLWGAGGLGALALVQIVFILWTTWRLRGLGHLRERMSRLADGLALLTDTTEAGLATLASADWSSSRQTRRRRRDRRRGPRSRSAWWKRRARATGSHAHRRATKRCRRAKCGCTWRSPDDRDARQIAARVRQRIEETACLAATTSR